MDDLDCPVTYHLGESLDLDAEFEAYSSGMFKPPGLWASPGRPSSDGGVYSAWMDRNLGEHYGPPGDGEQMWVLTPQPGAVVVRLDTEEDLLAFAIKYPGLAKPLRWDKEAAWRQVATSGVDAVLLTKRGTRAARQLLEDRDSQPVREVGNTFSTWDTSSACWFTTERLDAAPAQIGRYPRRQLTVEEQAELDQDPWAYVQTYDLDRCGDYDEGRPTTRAPRGTRRS